VPSRRALVLGFVAVVGLGSCSNGHGVLHTHGSPAGRTATLGWWMIAIAAVVGIGFYGALIFGIVRRRAPGREERRFRVSESAWIVAGGVVLPTVVVVGLSLASIGALPPRASADAVRIAAVGHQYWWEFHYLDDGFTTADELHVPVGRPVDIALASVDVIHSFWVPALAGKIDMVPGHTNHLEFTARTPGRYRGQCAEFCGLAHAQMIVTVTVDRPARYAAWLAAERVPAHDAATDETRAGRDAFLRLPCASCHTIRGTEATGVRGPDLTHFATRGAIGAGVIENTRGNLAGWIANSQAIKPGSLMPPIPMTPAELHAIVAYLESLT